MIARAEWENGSPGVNLGVSFPDRPATSGVDGGRVPKSLSRNKRMTTAAGGSGKGKGTPGKAKNRATGAHNAHLGQAKHNAFENFLNHSKESGAVSCNDERFRYQVKKWLYTDDRMIKNYIGSLRSRSCDQVLREKRMNPAEIFENMKFFTDVNFTHHQQKELEPHWAGLEMV